MDSFLEGKAGKKNQAVIENRILDFSVEHSREGDRDTSLEIEDSLIGKPSGDIGEIRR